jgi:hypothetical protein
MKAEEQTTTITSVYFTSLYVLQGRIAARQCSERKITPSFSYGK